MSRRRGTQHRKYGSRLRDLTKFSSRDQFDRWASRQSPQSSPEMIETLMANLPPGIGPNMVRTEARPLLVRVEQDGEIFVATCEEGGPTLKGLHGSGPTLEEAMDDLERAFDAQMEENARISLELREAWPAMAKAVGCDDFLAWAEEKDWRRDGRLTNAGRGSLAVFDITGFSDEDWFYERVASWCEDLQLDPAGYYG